jgi:8-oxo-dGTP pyrophosphatase MutT (NUDIX family)
MSLIRALAICIFSHNDKILVFEGYDPLKDEIFYRPLGGGIEFGERSEDTVHREMMEEIGVEVTDLVYLGALENIFVFNGEPGHEIVQVYDGSLKASGLYDQDEIQGNEAGAVEEEFIAMWKNLNEFGPGKSILYPDGLLEMLKR